MEEVLLVDTLLVGVIVVLSIGMRYGGEQVCRKNLASKTILCG